MKPYTITGHHAIRIAKRDGVTLRRYADTNSGASVTVSNFAAAFIAAEDAGLIYCTVTPCGWSKCSGKGFHVEDFFRDGRYLGPDEDGREPRWADAAPEKPAGHTSGPWTVAVLDSVHEYASIEAGDGVTELVRICDIPSWPCATEEAEANARLIASAPELLAALELTLAPLQTAYIESNRTGHGSEAAHAFLLARAAIAKARGQA